MLASQRIAIATTQKQFPYIATKLIYLFGVFHFVGWILPSLFGSIYIPFLPMTGEEFLELFTPLLLSLVYFVIFNAIKSKAAWTKYLFFTGIVLWIQGQEINSVANFFSKSSSMLPLSITDQLYFYDEFLGHLVWSLGFSILFGIFSYLSIKATSLPKIKNSAALTLSGLTTGLAMFLFAVEGQMTLIFIALTTFSIIFFVKTKKPQENALSHILFISAITTLILLIGWGIWFKGFPEFSQLGWI